jgi:hypothetical protein
MEKTKTKGQHKSDCQSTALAKKKEKKKVSSRSKKSNDLTGAKCQK